MKKNKVNLELIIDVALLFLFVLLIIGLVIAHNAAKKEKERYDDIVKYYDFRAEVLEYDKDYFIVKVVDPFITNVEEGEILKLSRNIEVRISDLPKIYVIHEIDFLFFKSEEVIGYKYIDEDEIIIGDVKHIRIREDLGYSIPEVINPILVIEPY